MKTKQSQPPHDIVYNKTISTPINFPRDISNKTLSELVYKSLRAIFLTELVHRFFFFAMHNLILFIYYFWWLLAGIFSSTSFRFFNIFFLRVKTLSTLCCLLFNLNTHLLVCTSRLTRILYLTFQIFQVFCIFVLKVWC